MDNVEKVTLEPTAAMALLLAQGIYKDNAHIAQYLQKIDLSSGMLLAERMKATVMHISELLENRKYFYHDYIFNHIRSSPSRLHNEQVIILGVGYDPISIHLLDEEGDHIESIIEIDMSNFDAKKTLFNEINVPNIEKIKFVQANVMANNLIDIVRANGYDPGKPAVITTEGLVYYLTKERFAETIKCFQSPDKRNTFCLDYIFPAITASTEDWRKQQQIGIESVERQAKMKLQLYTADEIVDLIKSVGGTSIQLSTQKDIELKKTGKNQYFPQKGAGVFEFISFKI